MANPYPSKLPVVAPPLRVVCDWDGTLTTKDTLHLVAKVAYDKQDLPLDGPADQYRPPAVPWSKLGEVYMQAYERHKREYQPAATSRCTLVEERAWLASLRDVELSGVIAAEQAAIFKGVTIRDLEQGAQEAVAAGEIVMRAGWHEFLSQLILRPHTGQRTAHTFHILSVNWSAEFIRHAIVTSWVRHAGAHRSITCSADVAEFLRRMDITANEISQVRELSGSDGGLRSPTREEIRTSEDKLKFLHPHCRGNLDTQERMGPRADEELVVYIGDSDTDLECLLAADIAIWIRDDPPSSAGKRLHSAVTRLNIPTKPVEELRMPGLQQPPIWIARDFHQVLSAFRAPGWL
ncbi:UPF0655 protein [Sphaceloma murrayae]|uniref:UPF0655 protein n=1 Tax=Sphaceloma murrayae TaxID=2082308 RepID=A0A2K1QRL1_9PEZI|nr:UPF0655 protein [Sphaceloma murrayae]